MAADAVTPRRELNSTASSPSSPADEPISEAHQEICDAATTDRADADDPAGDVEDYDGLADPDGIPGNAESTATSPRLRGAAAVVVVMVAALVALAGWSGFQAYQSHQADGLQRLLVQTARQGAVNLTTIDWQHADSDVERILASATGAFYDDFAQRQRPFIDMVTKLKSKTEGTITEAGLESETGDQAQVLVAVAVKSSMDGAEEQQPRLYRLRISVQKTGDEAKVSEVEFVP